MRAEEPTRLAPLGEDATAGTLPTRFERVAACLPQQLAIVADGRGWTYAEVNRRADRIAAVIVSRVPAGEGCVALLFPHGAELIIAMLAVLKAGKAYLALHLDTPATSRSELLGQAGPCLILIGDAGPEQLDGLAAIAPLLHLADVGAEVGRATRCLPPKPALLPELAAAIYYTSGSTGRPKGVVKSHAAVLHRAWIYTRNAGIGPEDRQSLLTDCSFAASEVDIFGALLNGATLSLFDLRRRGIGAFRDWIGAESISLLHPPVAFFRRFLSTLATGEQVPSVRLVALAGDRIQVADVVSWRRHFRPGSQMLQRFSISETGVLTVRRVCQQSSDQERPDRAPREGIGQPVAGKALWIAGVDGEPLVTGEVGEIMVSSRYLATGYWRDPEATRARFDADPDRPGWRRFRTGDLGYLRLDGELVHVGRSDHQVKVRGYRVELGEVEAALLALDGIREAAVIATGTGEMRLTAFVVPSGDGEVDASAIRARLRERLADWKLPSSICSMPELPLTGTGKIDRQRLASPPRRGEVVPTAPPLQAGAGSLDARLAALWCEALDLDPGGLDSVTDPDAGFFDLGGDSLAAMTLLAQLEAEFGLRVAPEQLHRFDSLRAFGDYLRGRDQRGPEPVIIALRKQGSRPPLFVAPRLYGDTLWCIHLFPYLHPEQPIHALVTPAGRRFERLEDLADFFAEALLSQRPQGGFRLLGYSFGGKLVYEIARQLARRGATTDFLGLLDVPAQRREYDTGRLARLLIRRAPRWALNLYWYLLDYFVLASPGERSAALRNKWSALRRLWRVYLLGSHGDGWDRMDKIPAYRLLPESAQQSTRRFIELFRDYRPRPYTGALTLYRVRAMPLLQPLDEDYGWGKLAQHGVEVRRIAGATHDSVTTRRHAPALADALNRSLCDLDASHVDQG